MDAQRLGVPEHRVDLAPVELSAHKRHNREVLDGLLRQTRPGERGRQAVGRRRGQRRDVKRFRLPEQVQIGAREGMAIRVSRGSVPCLSDGPHRAQDGVTLIGAGLGG